MSSEVRTLVYETLSAMSDELVLTIADYLTPEWVPTLRDVFWRFKWHIFEELWRKLPREDRVVPLCRLRRAFTHQFMQTVKVHMNFPYEPVKEGKPLISIEELCTYEADFISETDRTFGSYLIAAYKKRKWKCDENREEKWVKERLRAVGDREPCIASQLKDVSATQLICYYLVYRGFHADNLAQVVPRLIGTLYGPHGILWMLFVLTHLLKRGTPRYKDCLIDVYVWLEYATEAYLNKETHLYSLSENTLS
jgi:hypothetical protein